MSNASIVHDLMADLFSASLASLLGLLGHALAKVNALKVLRALLRHREDHLNGELTSGAQESQ